MAIREFFKRRPILSKFFGQRAGTTPETLTEAQRRLAEEFRRGIAEALGVPPEAIREEMVERWVIGFTKAFVKPEYWAQAVVTASEWEIRRLGRDIAEIVKEALRKFR